jgi:hypothetical protein
MSAYRLEAAISAPWFERLLLAKTGPTATRNEMTAFGSETGNPFLMGETAGDGPKQTPDS